MQVQWRDWSNKICTIALCLILLLSCKEDDIVAPQKQVQTNNPLITAMDLLVDDAFRGYAGKSRTAGFSLALIIGSDVHM